MSFGKVVKAKSKASQAADSAPSCSSPRGCSSCSSKRSPSESASSSSKSKASKAADDKLKAAADLRRKELKEKLQQAKRMQLQQSEVPGSRSIRAPDANFQDKAQPAAVAPR